MATPTIAMSAAETRRILACRHVRGEMHEQPAVLGRLSRHVEHFARQTGALAEARGGFRDVVFLAPARTQPVAILGRHAVVVRCGPQSGRGVGAGSGSGSRAESGEAEEGATLGLGGDRRERGQATAIGTRARPPLPGHSQAVPPDPDAGSRLVVALSPSGEDERVLELSRRAAASGSAVVAVTNDARSPLADAATLTVDLAAGLELSAMPTKTVTGMMLAVLALVDGLPAASDAPSSIADCAHALALAAAVADVLADQDSADAAAARLVAARRIAVLGQGHHHPAALETARMLRETAGLLVEGFSVEEFCSGPLGGFDAETAVVLLAGPGHTDVGPLRDQLHSRGAQVVVIGDTEDAAARPDLPLPGLRVSGAAECVLATVRGQQLAVAAARALGVDPDRPAVS